MRYVLEDNSYKLNYAKVSWIQKQPVLLMRL